MNLELKGISLGLRGAFQIKNAALALATVELLRPLSFFIQTDQILQGLFKVHWPGRLEIVKKAPLVILDGAHNPSAMKCLDNTIKNDFNFKRFFLVLGIMEDKNIKKMLEEIVKSAYMIILTQPRMDRAASTKALANILKNFQITNFKTVDDVHKAIHFTLSQARKDDLICITGSLFTVGEAQKLFCKN